jgi:uncharacterized Zn-finger protein
MQFSVAEGAVGANWISAKQTIFFPAQSELLGSIYVSLAPIMAHAYQTTPSPPRNITVFLAGEQIAVYALNSSATYNRQLVTIPASFRPQQGSLNATLEIRVSFSDGFNGAAVAGVDLVSIAACTTGELLKPTNLRCLDCPALSIPTPNGCSCPNNYLLVTNRTSASCSYCGDGYAAASGASSCIGCQGNQYPTKPKAPF